MNDKYSMLIDLQDKISRKNKVENVLKSLNFEHSQVEEQVKTLYSTYLKENMDYEKMSSGSMTSYFHKLIGKLDQKLEKEEREAYEARARYEHGVRELENIKKNIVRYELELEELKDCNKEYEQLFNERVEELIKEKGSLGIQVAQLQEEIGYNKSLHKETKEAIEAGKKLLKQLSVIQKLLDSAKGWSTYDVFGGGLVADLMKYDKLEAAEKELIQLQHVISNYKNELFDLELDESFTFKIDGFLSVFDFLFDGLFSDWAVLDRINNSIDQMHQVEFKVQQLQSHLNQKLIQCEVDNQNLEKELDQIILHL